MGYPLTIGLAETYGLELTQALQWLSSQDHMIEINDQLVTHKEGEVSQALKKSLERV